MPKGHPKFYLYFRNIVFGGTDFCASNLVIWKQDLWSPSPLYKQRIGARKRVVKCGYCLENGSLGQGKDIDVYKYPNTACIKPIGEKTLRRIGLDWYALNMKSRIFNFHQWFQIHKNRLMLIPFQFHHTTCKKCFHKE